jgi:hypothetical protein
LTLLLVVGVHLAGLPVQIIVGMSFSSMDLPLMCMGWWWVWW